MKRLITLICLCGFLLTVQAGETRYFDVEVIVFENLASSDRQSEIWPTSVQQDMPEKSIEIGKPYPGPLPREYSASLTFKRLRRHEYRLANDAKAIDASPSRRLLLHTAWRQPGMAMDNAMSVRINKAVPAISAEETGAIENNPVANHMAESPAANLEGYIKIMLSRYLHVEADLQLTEDLGDSESFYEENTETAQPAVYHLKQLRRRIRSGEVHYLDHPVLGMVLMIRPYDPNKKSG